MLLEEFIITVFCWVENCFETVTGGIELRIRRVAPGLSDGEVVMMEIVGELLDHDGNEALWAYFRRLR